MTNLAALYNRKRYHDKSEKKTTTLVYKNAQIYELVRGEKANLVTTYCRLLLQQRGRSKERHKAELSK
jgi:hypothetical protein